MPFNRPIPDPAPRRKNSAGLDTLVQAEKLMQIAILLPSAAFIGWLLGAWADKVFHQSWIAVAGIVFGGISGHRVCCPAGDHEPNPKTGRETTAASDD